MLTKWPPARQFFYAKCSQLIHFQRQYLNLAFDCYF